MYEMIKSPVNYGGIVLKNRIIFAPTSMGLTRDAYFEKVRKIAQGGCAMIIIGDVPIGKSSLFSLYGKRGMEYYQKLCRIVHSQGGKICAQLHQSDSNLWAMIKYIPGVLTKKISGDSLRRLLNQEVERYITQMPVKKIASILHSFGEAAVLAQKAGFDLIQVHGDRMCGSFSSSLFNKREDQFGGSIKRRTNFPVLAVKEIRKRLPDIPIDYKLPIRQENPHYGNAGILKEELRVFIPRLVQAGVTSFHVTLANHGNLSDTIPPANHPYFTGEGCFLPYCDFVKKYTDCPICGVGAFRSPDFIEKQLLDERMDCVAMSRQLLADPFWPHKVIKGNINAIKTCVGCNQDCLGGMKRHEGVHCIFDERKGR